MTAKQGRIKGNTEKFRAANSKLWKSTAWSFLQLRFRLFSVCPKWPCGYCRDCRAWV